MHYELCNDFLSLIDGFKSLLHSQANYTQDAQRKKKQSVGNALTMATTDPENEIKRLSSSSRSEKLTIWQFYSSFYAK